MKVSVSKTSLLEYGILLVFLLDICFWFIIPMETSFTGVNNKKLLTVLSLVLTVDVLFTTNEFKRLKYKYLNIFCIAYLMELIILSIYSMQKYPAQGLSGTLAMTYYFFVLLLVYPMLYVMNKKGLNRVLHGISIIATILLIVVFLQGILYPITGTIFMRAVLNTDNLWVRSGRIRIGLTNLGNIYILYYFTKAVRKKGNRRINDYIMLAIGLIDVFLIQMTRMASLAMVGALLVIYIVAEKKSARFIRFVLIAFAVVYIFFGTNLFDSFIQTFSTNNSEYGAGTRIRMEAIQYFWGFVKANPIFGMGLVNQDSYFTVLYGAAGRYYLSDVGIVGLITQGGWSMAVLYIIFIVRLVVILRKTRHDTSNSIRPFLFGLLTFTLLCTPSIIIWSRRTMLYIAYIMACFEYYYTSVNNEVKEGIQ